MRGERGDGRRKRARGAECLDAASDVPRTGKRTGEGGNERVCSSKSHNPGQIMGELLGGSVGGTGVWVVPPGGGAAPLPPTPSLSGMPRR